MLREIKSLSGSLPVTVLSGFLGCGKTTLLNRLLHAPHAARIAVIVNEFGSVGLDNLLVEAVDEELVLLGGGCVCCTFRGDLIDTLLDLKQRVDDGLIPAFERVLVETSGLSDPAPIMHALMTQVDISGFYYFDALVTVLDAELGGNTLLEYPEAVKQVAFADRIVISKTDIATAQAVSELRDQIRGINPGVAIVDSLADGFSARSVFSVGLYNSHAQRADPAGWLTSIAFEPVPSPRHHSGIETFSIVREQALNRAVLGMWLSELVRDHGNELLRIKGIIQVEDAQAPLVVHGVQHRFYPPAQLQEWPTEDHSSRIVFIVRGLSPGRVSRLLDDIEQRFAALAV